jgi:hypothetical protein
VVVVDEELDSIMRVGRGFVRRKRRNVMVEGVGGGGLPFPGPHEEYAPKIAV